MRKPVTTRRIIPEMTTIWPMNSRADIQSTVDRIKDKLDQYKTISELEQKFLDQFDLDPKK
jgi:hypothetical protein